MKQSLLRKTILVSLLGIASAQTSSWGQPFTVAASESAAAPTEAVSSVAVPSPVESSTRGESFTPGNSAALTSSPASFPASLPASFPASFPTSFPASNSDTTTLSVDTTSLAVGTTTPVLSSAAVVTGNATSASSKMSSSSASSSMRSTTRSSETSSSSTSTTTSSTTSQSSGAAVPLRGYQQMAFAGAIAGVGGAMFL